MNLRTLTVCEVNNYIKKLLFTDPILNSIMVKGELSNIKIHNSGHIYFSLKDDTSVLNCVMFKTNSENLQFVPKDGMAVIVNGYVSVYEKNGMYQLYVKEMLRDGLGELYVAYERLKYKLESMGYFDINKKKKLPFMPGKIGIVTSAQGAAVRDIISIINRRFKNVELIVYNTLVQGDKAPSEIRQGIEYFNNIEYVDVIIVCRGGGSIEELWAFNEEEVAHAIYNSKIPIISAVGHETDFTIADFVSDMRAPTPSAAGEIVVPEIKKIYKDLEVINDRIKCVMNKLIGYKYQRIEALKNSYGLRQPLERVMQYKQQLDFYYSRIRRDYIILIEKKKNDLERNIDKLNTLSPLAVLERGYAVIERIDKKGIVKSVQNMEKNDQLNIRMIDGNIGVTVFDIKKRVE